MDCTPSANGSRPAAPLDVIAPRADEKSADLARMKAVATALVAASVLIAILARALEPRHWAFSYVAAWAEAAAVGGLADWYAIVALFRHPLGIPMPHTAIIASNRTRIAESFGAFVHDQFLQPGPIGEKLRSVDFAALAAEWIADDQRSVAMSRFILKLAPQALKATEETGLKDFVAGRALAQLKALELAPFAAKLFAAAIEDGRHQRLFDDLLVGLHRLLSDETMLNAIREKIRHELPTVFNIFRADAYLVRRFVALISQAIDEAKNDREHPFRRDFDRFAREFVERLASSPELALRSERLKREFLARPEIGDLAEGLWLSFVAFVDEDARGDNSLLLRHMANFLADVGRKLSQEPRLRAEINIGAVKTLQAFIDNNKSEIARFITNQIKAWDVDRMIDIIELNIGRDLQYIRLNGTFVGGLAGLVLFAAERAAQLK
ncbi:MAG TPA: DUF445 family protein [Roseiarcus sp.]|nr:DUF445 family protein [Roseiarcus sp.]